MRSLRFLTLAVLGTNVLLCAQGQPLLPDSFTEVLDKVIEASRQGFRQIRGAAIAITPDVAHGNSRTYRWRTKAPLPQSQNCFIQQDVSLEYSCEILTAKSLRALDQMYDYVVAAVRATLGPGWRIEKVRGNPEMTLFRPANPSAFATEPSGSIRPNIVGTGGVGPFYVSISIRAPDAAEQVEGQSLLRPTIVRAQDRMSGKEVFGVEQQLHARLKSVLAKQCEALGFSELGLREVGFKNDCRTDLSGAAGVIGVVGDDKWHCAVEALGACSTALVSWKQFKELVCQVDQGIAASLSSEWPVGPEEHADCESLLAGLGSRGTARQVEADIPGQIDSIARSGRYFPLPEPEITPVPTGANQLSAIRVIRNNTGYALHLLMTGSIERSIDLAPGASSSLEVPPGTYRVAARVDSQGVQPFYGVQVLRAGMEYTSTFYIQ